MRCYAQTPLRELTAFPGTPDWISGRGKAVGKEERKGRCGEEGKRNRR